MGNNLQKKGVMMGDDNSQESKQIDKLKIRLNRRLEKLS